MEIQTVSNSDEIKIEPKNLPTFKPVAMEEIVTLEVLREVFKTYDASLEVLDFCVEPGTARGDNFLSLMYAVNVKLKRRSKAGTSNENMEIMFKAVPRNPMRQAIVKEGKYFLKEAMMYNRIIPLLSNGTNFASFPKCLAAFYDPDSESSGYIAMTNLKLQGFKMLPRNHWLDLDHATLVMTQLAQFHALSFAKWNGDGEAILDLFPEIKETLWLHPDSVAAMTKLFIDNTFPSLRTLLEQGKYFEEGRLLMEHVKDVFQRMHELTSVSSKYPNVVNHGDLWCNNILFKCNESGNAEELKLVDYQISMVGSRMIDITYVLFTSLQIPVLNQNVMDLLRIYFDEFDRYLITELNTKSPIQFRGQDLTWNFFVEEWEAYRYFGITMAFLYMPSMCAKPENIPDMETLVIEDLEQGQGKEGEDKFAEFMNVEHTLPRVYNLVRNHLPA